MTVATLPRPAASPPDAPRRSFFDDVEGLRGIAVTIVVLFHAGVPKMTGGFVGVDLFFVISGFLITGLLVKEMEHNGRIALKAFYARRARRIIPPAAVTVVATSVAVWLLMPLLSVFRQAFDLLAAALQIANWRFILQGKDYLAGASDDSVATHFWSLSVEEQFYFVWPLLVIGLAYLARRFGWSIRLVVGVGVGAVSIGSLVSSLYLTVADPVVAYMATHTRAWQFGVGALVAVMQPLLARHAHLGWLRGAAVLVGWAGLSAVVVATVTFGHTTPYPGAAALLPTLGGGAMIAAGQIAGTARPAVGAVLVVGWLRWIGKVSYAWYLWHWPVIVLFKQATGVTDWHVLVPVSLGALVLAWISTSLLERPLMSSAELKRNLMASIAVGMTGTVAAVAMTMTIGVFAVKAASSGITSSNVNVSFTSVFGTPTGVTSGPVTPNPFKAFDDRPPQDECLIQLGNRETPSTCVQGPADGVPAVLFGDSHAQQWLPAIAKIASANEWRLSWYTKAACPAAALQPRDGRTDPFTKPDCLGWREDSLNAIAALQPKFIVIGSLSTYVPDYQEFKLAWDQTLDRLRATGAKLIYIRDTPYPQRNIPECVSGALDDWSKCDFDLNNVRRTEPIVTDQLRGENLDIPVLDVNPFLCQGTKCLAVRNGTLMYRDDSHLTATAINALIPAVEQEIKGLGLDLKGR
ncbi:putative acyltransferase [Mycolicibacterium canariasense]|uniref:Putative acyltransferase n=1 Tax=Mycolicibacterium canariasense TaxID=228230 RepID=A0A100WGH5_MYCCR|nr:acyltransferase family protein [Mycolicibacterium canariasense]MCV7209826.1 acyltransferase [Mycolicibacterium canariasense]ORU99718.1 acyltransferase [Mycolicibacterium canariasense]GAS97836.1 putative acyltransferase [Mycolicibacterium canariasense]